MEDQIYRVRIHQKEPTARNPHILALVFWENNNPGAWKRIFRHRRIDSRWITERDMTLAEKTMIQKAWRMHYVQYLSWDALISDELLIVGDLQWAEKLRAIARQPNKMSH